MGRHPRLSWLAACALLFACGGDPAPKQVEQPRTGFKSKKKKHKSEDADASTDSEKPRSKEDKERELEREAEQERQERKERQRKREQEAEEEETHVAATDDGGSSDADSDAGEKSEDDADAKKAADEKKAEQEEAKAKKKAAREEALAKKKAAAEEAKAKKLAAAEAKKNKKKKGKQEAEEASSDEASSEGEATKTDEETAAAEEATAADEETPKAKKKRAKEAKEAKAKKKVAKADDEEKTSDEEAPKAEPKAKARKGKTKAKEKEKEKEKEADDDSEQKAAKEPNSDEESIDMEETTTASIKDPSHDSDELDLTSTTPKETKEEETAPPVPFEIDRRPLTAAKGKLEVHGGLRVGVLTAPNGMGGSVSSTSEGLALGATYGLGGKAEVGFDYTVGLNPGSAKGPLLFHGAYRVSQSEKFDMALAAGFAADFISVKDPTTMMTTSQTATALQLGGWARYHVGRTLSVFTGLPALPSSSGSLAGTAAPLPPLPYQLTIGLSSKGAIALDVPVGAGYQATPKIYAFASLDLARLGMSNADSAFVFADFIPLALGGFYTANKIDIGAVLGDDLKQGIDYLRFDVVARYSLK